MRVRLTAAGVALAAVLTLGSSPAQAQAYTPGDETPEQYPAGRGRDDTFYACTACHGFKLIAAQGQTRRQWDDTIAWMVSKFAMPPLDPKDQAIVLDYLEATYPPRAPAGRGGWQNPFAPK